MTLIANTAHTPGQSGGNGLTPLQTPVALDALGALGSVGSWMKELIVDALAQERRDGGDGVIDTNGAPMLSAPLTDFSGDQLALILAAIDTQIKEAQGRTAKEGIEAARVRTAAANQEIQEKLQEAIDERREAAEKEKQNKVWGWIGKIAAFVGAIVAVVTAVAATIATGAAAAPLLAIAVIGLVAATVDLANQINQEVNPGAESFTLGSLLGDAFIATMDHLGLDGKDRAALSGMGALLGFMLMQPDMAGQMAEDAALADGRSAEFAANMRMGVMIAAVVTTVVAMIVVTVASGGSSSGNLANSTAKTAAQTADTAADVGTAAAKTADAASDVAKAADTVGKVTKATDMATKVNRAAKVLGGITAVVQGTSGVAQGAIGIQTAEDLRDAEKARAEAKKLDAVLLALQAQTEEQTQRLKDIIAALEEGMVQFSQMIATAGDQRANQIRNLVHA